MMPKQLGVLSPVSKLSSNSSHNTQKPRAAYESTLPSLRDTKITPPTPKASTKKTRQEEPLQPLVGSQIKSPHYTSESQRSQKSTVKLDGALDDDDGDDNSQRFYLPMTPTTPSSLSSFSTVCTSLPSRSSSLTLSSTASGDMPKNGSPGQEFPCRRIDKCKWSLLDESVSKYEEQKKVVGKSKSWKSRRVTVNSQLGEGERGLNEPQACLHCFKRSDVQTREMERLILTRSSFAAVVESGKQYGAGKWVIKVHGTILSGQQSSRPNKEVDRKRNSYQQGEWLLQFGKADRMQVWIKQLKSLIAQLHDIERAFRQGSDLTQSTSLLAHRNRSTSCSEMKLSYLESVVGSKDRLNIPRLHTLEHSGHQSDSVEELATSTDSLQLHVQSVRRGLVTSTVSKQSRKSREAIAADPSFKEEICSSPSNRIHMDQSKMRPRNGLQSGHQTSSTSQVVLPLNYNGLASMSQSPLIKEGNDSPSSQHHYPYPSSQGSSPQSRGDESDGQSLSQFQWQRSCSSTPATSPDSRQCIPSPLSPLSPYSNSSKREVANVITRRRGEKKTLRLEDDSLRQQTTTTTTIPCKLPFIESMLDSPTDPDTIFTGNYSSLYPSEHSSNSRSSSLTHQSQQSFDSDDSAYGFAM